MPESVISAWSQFKKKQIAEMRPWLPGDHMTDISVNEVDKKNGSPKAGDWVARNPANHADQWIVSAKFFEENYEPV